MALAAGDDDFDGYEHLVSVGAYKGHWQGEFEITADMLKQMETFGNRNKLDTPADYGHALVFDSSADAAGWIKPGDFEVRGEGKKARLFARIAWTEKARAKIAAQELKYKSPTIIFNTKDRKTGRMGGASLHSVALTNTPFLDDLPPVRLNSIMGALAALSAPEPAPDKENTMDELRENLIEALGLSADATDEQILAEAKTAKAAGADLKALTDAIPGEDKQSALSELKAKAATADATTARVAALEAVEAQREQERKDAAALEAVKAAQAEGKILGEETEHFRLHLELAKQDPEKFAALAAAMPRIVPLSDAPKRKLDAGSSEADELARKVNAALGLSDDVYKKFTEAPSA